MDIEKSFDPFGGTDAVILPSDSTRSKLISLRTAGHLCSEAANDLSIDASLGVKALDL